jgi:hypothetical protein
MSYRWNKGSWVAAGLILAMLAPFPATQSAAQSDSDAKRTPIYVSDFELASVGGTRSAPKTTNEAAPPPDQTNQSTNPIFSDSDPAPVQARRLVDAFGTILADSLRKSGYTVTRQGGSVPPSGLLLRGVFAEPDQENHIRRAILGTAAPGPSYTLYVGAFNLGHQDQPLYLPAVVQSPDPRYGPVITLNAYIPMVKFDVPKNPTDEDVRKICGQIVSQLTALLTQNPNAVSR